MPDIPQEDPDTYAMLQTGDSVGVFQVESRAQINLLPRLKPATYYGLVVQVAIVRLGPIQGDLTPFRDKLLIGMKERGHTDDFTERLYQQICGFGGYGLPESHAASFALLVYVSAWITRHYPAAFYCALLNSQPMGFYSASQLVQDARRHGVDIQPLDVNHSQRDHTLHFQVPQSQAPRSQPLQTQTDHSLSLRPGLSQIRGLSPQAGTSVSAKRPETGYTSSSQLRQLTGLNQRDMGLLAGANAMPGFTSNRHQAYWQLLGHEQPAELFIGEDNSAPEPACEQLPTPNEGQNIAADYSSQGLTPQRHPLALLREQGHLRFCLSASELNTIEPGRPVQVAGLVTGRQQRKPPLTARLLHVKGVLERESDTVHIVAGKLSDLSHRIKALPLSSRNFH
jgi:error-prone DNA polymerase